MIIWQAGKTRHEFGEKHRQHTRSAKCHIHFPNKVLIATYSFSHQLYQKFRKQHYNDTDREKVLWLRCDAMRCSRASRTRRSYRYPWIMKMAMWRRRWCSSLAEVGVERAPPPGVTSSLAPERAAYWLSSLESQATIFTLPTCSVVSSFLNCASVRMNVHTLSQNL